MLRQATATGWATARRAGAPALGLSALSYVPLAAAAVTEVTALFFFGMVLHVLVMLALIRLLGARRPTPIVPAPTADANGRPLLQPIRPAEPVGVADARARTALRKAVPLVRPAIRYSVVVLLIYLTAALTVYTLSNGRAQDYSPRLVVLVSLPVVAVLLTFVRLAPQRIALEGDPRVLVAVAHSVRVARQHFGPLFLLTSVEPVLAAGGVLITGTDDPSLALVGVTLAMNLLALSAQVVVTAVSSEFYLHGPRLDIPAATPA